MWVIGAGLIYLAVKKQMEPTLLLPMGFGAILVNLPMSGAVNQWMVGNSPATAEQIASGAAELEHGVIDVLFNAGIANE